MNHDYEGFAAQELEIRAKVGLPPYRRLARIILAHEREEIVVREGTTLADRIRNAIASEGTGESDVLGPNPCALSRLRGKYRYDLLVRTPNASSMRRLLSRLTESGELRTKAQTTIVDVDPVALM